MGPWRYKPKIVAQQLVIPEMGKLDLDINPNSADY